MGRPPIFERFTKKNLTLSDEMWERVGKYRHREEFDTEQAALRALLDGALKAAGIGKAKGRKRDGG